MALLGGCVTAQGGAKDWSDSKLPPANYTREPNNGVVGVDSQTVIAATVLQMMNRDTSSAPVAWAKGGDFKAAFDTFTYEDFAVTGVDVFDQQQAPDGKITVQALVRMQHRTGVRAANIVSAVYAMETAPQSAPAQEPEAKAVQKQGKTKTKSKAKTSSKQAKAPAMVFQPVIYKTLAGPVPSRDPDLEVLVVRSELVAQEAAFMQPSYPAWLEAARRLASPMPNMGKTKVHVFVFAKERVMATPDLKISSDSGKPGRSACLDDMGFAACVIAGEMSGQHNRAMFYLNGNKAADALVK